MKKRLSRILLTVITVISIITLSVTTAFAAKIQISCNKPSSADTACNGSNCNRLTADNIADDLLSSLKCGSYCNKILSTIKSNCSNNGSNCISIRDIMCKYFGYCNQGDCNNASDNCNKQTPDNNISKPEKPNTDIQQTDTSGNKTPQNNTENTKPSKNDNIKNDSALSEYEKEVVRLVNDIRVKNGLNALKINEKLSSVAREKSQNMHDLRYFDHTSPTYGSPFDMMKSFGITYRYAGENIAMGYSTPEAVVNAWMNSPGHRANILKASYTEIGVGYVSSGNYCTQMFIG